jgi:ribonuclease E
MAASRALRRQGFQSMETKNKMLIDATHAEETRVVVLRNGKVEEFDYESAARKLLRGNIYLAKVTRVEPSLQAAFVDYGGNRHGFLAFNEIHPDYYQIPVADRQALLEEAEAEAKAEAEAEAREDGDEGPAADAEPRESRGTRRRGRGEPNGHRAEAVAAEATDPAAASTVSAGPTEGSESGPAAAATTESEVDEACSENGSHVEEIEENGSDGADAPEMVGASMEQVGTEDALEEVPERPRRHIRSYKIQEVIKRRQIILVQVVKEERGSKGAALTTYLSLAGRYTVLMPNTGRGGGISRKITNPQDRKRLKAIAQELEVPEGMGLIIRTAGAARTKQEIKRDFEYLLRLWENVRDLTLQSTAPSLVYEEGNLIKRSIRDLYSKDIDEIQVAGDAAHREAQDFMRMLSPSQAKNVVRYEEPEALFSRYQIERQLNAMFSPYVTLRSGGYLVINQTEALVAVDVNSGKATREFSIEETALQTNLEAAEEIARQVKLRDLAGLIVIDFIDMEERRNNRRVESRLKEALRHDRARIQVGRISHFGLLEMSRQRLRTGVMEGSTSQCPHCQGTGIVRSTESVALAVLRALEDHLARDSRSSLTAVTTAEVALYILNNKRAFITEMEHRYGISIAVEAGERMQGANFAIEKSAAPATPPRAVERSSAVNMEWAFDGETDEEAADPGQRVEEAESHGEAEADERRPRRRRRRGRRDDRAERRSEPAHSAGDGNGHGETHPEGNLMGQAPDDGSYEEGTEAAAEIPGLGEQPAAPLGEEERDDRHGGRRRRRGRRGGRRGRERNGAHGEAEGAPSAGAGAHDEMPETADIGETTADAAALEEAEAAEPAGERSVAEPAEAPPPERTPEPLEATSGTELETKPESASEPPESVPPAMVEPAHGPGPSPPAIEAVPDEHAEAVQAEPAQSDPLKPARKGWWQRRATVD